jgi:hypothetical protein
VSADGRGNTHRGRPTTLPDGLYEPSIDPVMADRWGPARLLVNFRGEDGREHAFDVSALPLPGWHEALAEAWAKRIGPEGSLRTLASALGTWYVLARFMRFMAQRLKPPAIPAELTRADIEAFYNRDNAPKWSGTDEMRRVTLLFAVSPLRELISTDVNDYVRKPTLNGTDHGKPGYSDAEYRRILNAARADAAAIRDRIRRGRKLVQLWRNDRNGLTAEDNRLAEQLAAISASGDVPEGPNVTTAAITRFRSQLAQHLYVTKVDVTPLMLLLVALTGLNAESVKELPADHRVLEDCAVELEFVKRRRGAGHWNQTVTWEIGPPGRELHHPGGLYLLLLDLMAPSRAISGSTTLWCIWRNGHRLKLTTADEHCSPFDGALHTHIARSQAWSARRGLLADGDDQPLVVTMQRLRTTVQIRRTKQMGGHVPSAAETNTIHTLFRDYLRDDPFVRDWAGDVVADALAEAERAALDAHRRALTSTGGKLEVRADDSGLEGGVHPTAWGSCRDPDRHPHSGKPCRATFLDCFHCQNCLITTSHLPRLLALMRAFTRRRQMLGEADWWSRYGHVWAAIREDVLPRFTPAQLEKARAIEPCDALLDLVEAPWEKP